MVSRIGYPSCTPIIAYKYKRKFLYKSFIFNFLVGHEAYKKTINISSNITY